MPVPSGTVSPASDSSSRAPRPHGALWGWPGGIIALAGGVVSGYLLYLLERFALSGTFIDLSVAGTAAAVDKVIFKLSPDDLESIRQGAFFDFVLIAAYLASIVWGILWAQPSLKSHVMLGASRVALFAVVFGAVLDAVKNVAVLILVNGGRGAWPLVSASAAWPRWFLVLPSTLFAIVVVFARFNALIQERHRQKLRAKQSTATADQPKRPGLIPQSFSALTPYPIPSETAHEEGEPPWPDWKPDSENGKLGICCSGGGVRSAAYNLGALQALHVAGVFQKARYLAAVSGGAYMAAAHAIVRGEDPTSFEEVFEYAPRSPEEKYLRTHLKYLADSFRSKVKMVGRVFMGALVNFLFFYLLLWVVSRPTGWFLTMTYMHPELEHRLFTLQPHLWFVTLWPAVIGVLVGMLALFIRFRSDRTYKLFVRIASGLAGLSAWMIIVIIVLPWLVVQLPQWITQFLDWLPGVRVEESETRNYLWLFQVIGGTALVGAAARVLLRRKATIALLVAGILIPLAALSAFVLMVGDAAVLGPMGQVSVFGNELGPQLYWFCFLLLVLLVFSALSDETLWSMHPFYKRRLASAYALHRTGPTEARPVDYDKLLSLSSYARKSLSKTDHWPELIVCAAANVSGVGDAPTGRRAVSFTFGPREVGGPDVGWIKTKDMEESLDWRRRRDITLPAAVAISGAALSPAMGKMTRSGVTALLALANARLGVWLPNPSWVKAMPNGSMWRQRPRVRYLFNEMLGKHPSRGLFLYVTDGGHWENLGLVELLRRGCTEIYCFDAAGDKVDTFFTLGEAVALARTELGVEININPEVMEPADSAKSEGQHAHPDASKRTKETSESPKEPSRSQADFVVATFTYPNQVKGKLIYCKAAVTESDPWDVKSYAEKDNDFPTHGTIHQLYREERFEAYRALGYHTATRAVTGSNVSWTQQALDRFRGAINKPRVPDRY